MQSLKELYKIGNGPSSSHTMGPKRAAEMFKKLHEDADKFEVILYGSLALTGKGHLTDKIIEKTLQGTETEIKMDVITECTVHPNTMDLIAYKKGQEIDKMRVYSVGGGTIKIEGEKESIVPEIYPHKNFEEIKLYCKENNIDLCQYVYEVEGKEELEKYLAEVWQAMKQAVETGLNTTGIIPGRLKLKRRASEIFDFGLEEETPEIRRSRLLSSYAYAVSEENASGGQIVTAPTCGASGVVPAVLYYMQTEKGYTDEQIINALAVAGLFGNIIKQNASISGAECGCQAEIGTACSMAAAATAYLLKLDIGRIENSAEVAMEHHLGLTCDPVYGYVQIPCIERNAVAAMRAVDSAYLSLLLEIHKSIPFDMVVETMYETGRDLRSHYRETSNGGLAKKYCRNKYYNKELNSD
ncbi:MAG: L-serine ammonia-lyase, iron-sulfur-dependent, subunit alpha [Clostridia bacterium]|nr:L-serine ammonia-lyase, iron-sulfur-dependent, subunit alpha [Clostridia bacterium]